MLGASNSKYSYDYNMTHMIYNFSVLIFEVVFVYSFNFQLNEVAVFYTSSRLVSILHTVLASLEMVVAVASTDTKT